MHGTHGNLAGGALREQETSLTDHGSVAPSEKRQSAPTVVFSRPPHQTSVSTAVPLIADKRVAHPALRKACGALSSPPPAPPFSSLYTSSTNAREPLLPHTDCRFRDHRFVNTTDVPHGIHGQHLFGRFVELRRGKQVGPIFRRTSGRHQLAGVLSYTRQTKDKNFSSEREDVRRANNTPLLTRTTRRRCAATKNRGRKKIENDLTPHTDTAVSEYKNSSHVSAHHTHTNRQP